MRLRLVHKLSLLMLSYALLAVLALGGFTAWNLRQGFGEYLAARDLEQLERFGGQVERWIQSHGTQGLQSGAVSLHQLLNQDGGEWPVWPDLGRPPPPGRGQPPPGGLDALPSRLSLVGIDGKIWLRSASHASEPFADRPIHINGAPVARARLALLTGIPRNESGFLTTQYAGIAAVAAALVLLALCSAYWLSLRWVKPLLAVQSATQALATGELGARISVPQRVGQQGNEGDEIDDVVHNVNQMAESLQRLESSRRRWLAEISHELRTPLTVLQGDIEALCDGVRPLQLSAIQVLREEALSLGKIVNDLHLLALSDLHAVPCHFADGCAAEGLARGVERFRERARSAGLTLEWEPGDGASSAVRWDADRMQQALACLLDNSLRYTDAPGLIRVSLNPVGERLHICVDDSGPGVNEADLVRIFDPLYRAEASRNRIVGGSGLGLAICQAIVQAHGGHSKAALSRLGGLRIELDLPLQAGTVT